MGLLSERLAAVARYVEPGSIVADIGTDHAYLPVYLVTAGICPRIVASEVNQLPYLSALKTVEEHGLSGWISVRQGDGLTILRPGEVNTVVIAGVGGTTIQQILGKSAPALQGVKRLILQPMVGAKTLRQWLLTNGWQIIDEQLVAEDDFLYVIIVAERGQQTIDDELLLEIGPVLWRKKDPLLAKYLQRQIEHLEKVKIELTRGRTHRAVNKQDEISQHIERMRRMLLDVTSMSGHNQPAGRTGSPDLG